MRSRSVAALLSKYTQVYIYVCIRVKSALFYICGEKWIRKVLSRICSVLSKILLLMKSKVDIDENIELFV